MKNYVRVCICLDEESIQALDVLSYANGLNKSEQVKRLVLIEARKHGWKYRSDYGKD